MRMEIVRLWWQQSFLTASKAIHSGSSLWSALLEQVPLLPLKFALYRPYLCCPKLVKDRQSTSLFSSQQVFRTTKFHFHDKGCGLSQATIVHAQNNLRLVVTNHIQPWPVTSNQNLLPWAAKCHYLTQLIIFCRNQSRPGVISTAEHNQLQPRTMGLSTVKP